MVHIDYSDSYCPSKYTRKIKETHFGDGNQQVISMFLLGGMVESFASLVACFYTMPKPNGQCKPELRIIRGAYNNFKLANSSDDV